MRPIVKRVKKALLGAFERVEVQGDVSEISTISKLLLSIDESEAAEAAAAAHGPAITTVERIILHGWEQYLTPDERAELDALREAAASRAAAAGVRFDHSDARPETEAAEEDADVFIV